MKCEICNYRDAIMRAGMVQACYWCGGPILKYLAMFKARLEEIPTPEWIKNRRG